MIDHVEGLLELLYLILIEHSEDIAGSSLGPLLSGASTACSLSRRHLEIVFLKMSWWWMRMNALCLSLWVSLSPPQAFRMIKTTSGDSWEQCVGLVCKQQTLCSYWGTNQTPLYPGNNTEHISVKKPSTNLYVFLSENIIDKLELKTSTEWELQFCAGHIYPATHHVASLATLSYLKEPTPSHYIYHIYDDLWTYVYILYPVTIWQDMTWQGLVQTLSLKI